MDEKRSPVVAKRIVVGVDGSAQSLRAVEWAVWQAEKLGAPLEIVHVDIVDDDVLQHLDYTARIEREALTVAMDRATALATGLVIIGKVMGPPTIESLLDESHDALMLVVGSRGLGSVRTLVLGSVSQACVARSRCPVMIIGTAVTPPQW